MCSWHCEQGGVAACRGVVNKAVLSCVHGVVWGFSCTHVLHRQAEITCGSERTKSRLEKWSHRE